MRESERGGRGEEGADRAAAEQMEGGRGREVLSSQPSPGIINSLCGPLTPAACRHVARWPLGFASLLVVFFLFFPRSGNRHRLEEQAGQFNLICKKQDCTEIKTRLKDA